MNDTPTIEELALRVEAVESDLGIVMQKVDDHETRLGASEKEREWMLAVLLRVLDGVGELKERTTVITQRSEDSDASLRDIQSKIDKIVSKLDSVADLEKKLNARPCLVDPCPLKE